MGLEEDEEDVSIKTKIKKNEKKQNLFYQLSKGIIRVGKKTRMPARAKCRRRHLL